MVLRENIVSFCASVRGPLHIKNDIPNQDYCLIKQLKNATIMVVSDGVGSKPKSDIGSFFACRAMVSTISEYLRTCPCASHRDMLRLFNARWNLYISPENAEDCSATVLFAVYTDERIITGRLGDGMICVGYEDRNVILSDNKNESFSNISNCMHRKFNYESWEIKELKSDKLDFILLCTDGISDDIKAENRYAFAKEFANEYSVMTYQKRSHNIRKMLSEWPVPMHTDDKTIACLKVMRSNNV